MAKTIETAKPASQVEVATPSTTTSATSSTVAPAPSGQTVENKAEALQTEQNALAKREDEALAGLSVAGGPPAPGTGGAGGIEMITVETTGAFMLHDTTTGYTVPHDEEATVPLSTFIQDALDLKRLKKA